jgi:hypothetical protein
VVAAVGWAVGAALGSGVAGDAVGCVRAWGVVVIATGWAAIGVGVPIIAETGPGVGRASEIVDVTLPSALNRAPTADQARLPRSKMPTMPTMVAISRVGEPSSGRAERSTSLKRSGWATARHAFRRYKRHTI